MSTAVPHQPYSVWAPEAETVTLVFVPTRPGELRGTESTTDQQLPFGHTWPVSHRVPLHRADTDSGWWVPAVVDLEQALAELQERTGQSDPGYGYSLNGGHPFPDPRARRLPDTVHGPARRNTAGTSASMGAPASSPLRTPRHQGLRGAVIYELHVGTFTPEGTLDASISYLDHLVELGITHVELMPVNSFSGARNWGYDGVGWYAVDESYGGPEAYRRFIAACHQAGLGVIQDVVYNHFGPDGNYLPQFGPYLNPTETGWGQSLNLDGPGSDEVRRYILDNARMFLGEYGVDGLRLDAVHALHDTRALHLLEELAALADELTEISGVEKFMVAESDLNDPHLLNARPGGYGLHGQWSDDFHHAVHVAVTGETQGYYHDFAPLSALAKVYNHGFFHNGTYSSFRQRHHGRPLPKHTPAHALVVSIQNHDQVGNRAAGDRPSATLTETQLAQSAALMLTGPYTPMLFMGEEWGATTPFAFFSAHRDPDLGRAVTEGRRREFARMEWSHDEVPDPQSEQTFIDSTLDWAELTDPQRPDHARLLEFYRSLIRFRAEHPELTDADRSTTFAEVDESHSWLRLDRGVTTPDQPGSVVVLAALGEHPLLVPPELTDAGYQIVLSYGLTDTAIAPGGVAILTR